MMFKPSYMLFPPLMALSLTLLTTSSALLWAWLSLEVALLSFLPLLQTQTRETSETAMKYFLAQSFGSMVFMVALLTHTPLSVSYTLIILALALKMGAAPLHQWFISISEGLPWPTAMMTMTVMKLPPLLIMLNLSTEQTTPNTLIAIILMSAMMGAVGALPQSLLRKMMFYSSLNTLAWLLLAQTVNKAMFTTYFITYLLILAAIILPAHHSQLFSLNKLMNNPKSVPALLMGFNMLSLAGLPPLPGFLPKIALMHYLTWHSHAFSLLIMLTSALISLYFYSRLTLNITLSPMAMEPYKTMKMTKMNALINVLTMAPPIYTLLH